VHLKNIRAIFKELRIIGDKFHDFCRGGQKSPHQFTTPNLTLNASNALLITFKTDTRAKYLPEYRCCDEHHLFFLGK